MDDVTAAPPTLRSAGAGVATTLGLLAGLLNVNFLIELALPHRTPLGSTVVSDLAVGGRPWFWAFRLGDALSAVLLLALCALAWRGGSRLWRAVAVTTAVFALSTLLAVLFPEHCAVSAAHPCAASLAEQSWRDTVHDLISTLGTACGIVAALLAALATRAARPGRRGVEPAGHLAAFVLGGAAGLAFMLLQAAGGRHGLGWIQRGQIAVLSAWFAWVGRSVSRRPGRIRA